MGLASRVLRRMRRARPDPLLTREYWEDAAGGSVEKAVDAICDGYDPRQFAKSGGVHFDESELGASHVVLDLACGMGRTCRHVAGRVREYHGVDFIPEMIAKARDHNRGVPNVMSKTRDSSEPALDAHALQSRNPAHYRNIRPDAAPSAARHGASGRRPAAEAARFRAPPAPPPFQACQYAFLISVAHGFTPFMMMPAAFAGVPPPSPRCRLMQL